MSKDAITNNISDIVLNNIENKYENIFDQSNFLYTPIKNALKIVHEFIKDKDLVLYGGMSQDLVLQSRGHPGIYSEHKLPDFDMFSPDAYNHSNELAVILMKAGFSQISAINALHATTRRTRVLFTPVADISYMPASVYERLETIRVIHGPYKGLRIIHFIYIYMDFLRFYVYSFENAPMEPVQERFNKISKRFKMIIENCPLEYHKYDLPTTNITNVISGTSITNVISDGIVQPHLIHGLAAYRLYLEYFKKNYGKYYSSITSDRGSGEGTFPFFDDSQNRDSEKKDVFPPCFIGDFSELQEKADQILNPFLDIQPLTYIIGGAEYWSSDKPVIYTTFEMLDSEKKEDSVKGVICIYGVFLYFIRKYVQTDNMDEKNMCKHLALSVQHMITAAETEFMTALPSYTREEAKARYDANPFFYHVNIFGKRNEVTIDNIEKKKAELKDQVYMSNLPEFGFYPERYDADHVILPTFDYSSSIKFAIDGLPRDPKFTM